MAHGVVSNNIKIIGVKVLPLPLQKYRYWYRQYFQCKVLVLLLAILFVSIINKPDHRYQNMIISECAWRWQHSICCLHSRKLNLKLNCPSSLEIYLQCFDVAVWWQEGHLACKNWVMGYWHGYLSEVRCKWFANGPADTIATPSALASLKSIMAYLFDACLHRLSWKKGH